jgi:opacity protein-like surface antigen
MNPAIFRVKLKALFAALTGALALTAAAQDFDNEPFDFSEPLKQTTKYGISPFYGYRFGGEIEDANGKSYDFEDSPAYGLILDYAPIDYPGRIELLWTRQDSSIDFGSYANLGKLDLTIDTLQLGGIAEFGTAGFREYVSAHVGATRTVAEGSDDEVKFSFSIGAGVKAYLSKNFYLRADLRGFCNVVNSEVAFIYANGATVLFYSGDTIWQGQASVGVGLTF